MQSLVEILDSSDAKVSSEGADGLLSNLMAEILLLAEELCVARDKFAVALKVAEQGCEVTKQNVSEYRYSDGDIDERLAVHSALYESIYNRLSETANASAV